MTSSLIDYHIPEAIQIRVSKVGDFEPPISIALPVVVQTDSPPPLPNPSHLIEVGQDVVNASSTSKDLLLSSHRQCVTFCVDPQLTSYAILQTLIVRAFNLHCDFLLYYDEHGNSFSSGKEEASAIIAPFEHNLHPLASDGDLQSAFTAYRRSPFRPLFLSISLHLIDYSKMATNPPPVINSSKTATKKPSSSSSTNPTSTNSTTNSTTTVSSYRNLLSDWDVVTSSDVILAQTLSATNTFLAKQLERIKERAFTTSTATTTTGTTSSSAQKEVNNGSYWYLAESIYQYIITTTAAAGGGNEAEKRPIPMDDAAFRAFQDGEGRIGGRARRDLRIAVYRRGVEPSLRRVIWKHLLNVYPEGVSGQERLDYLRLRCQTYRQMRDLWQNQVTADPEVTALLHMVRKDVYRTDRHHPFYANKKGTGNGSLEEEDNPNVTSLLNILITYALNHRTRYCQGMSDLASPLLYVMKDEAHGYVAFCALMSRLAENFNTDGHAMGRKFDHLSALLRHYDPEFSRYLAEAGASELLFAYRWLLLDLKREFPFEEMLEVAEVIWASIPPASGAHYRNLFDEGCLYTPGRQKRAEEAAAKEAAAAKVQTEQQQQQQQQKIQLEKETPKTKTLKPKQLTTADQRTLRSIKFLPSALSAEDPSQVLDSPSEGDEGKCAIWNLPPPAENVFGYAFELEDEVEVEVEEEVKSGAGKPRTDSTMSSSRQIEDNVSSCSTFDSGCIQRSNTLSSVVQASDDSAQSCSTKKDSEGGGSSSSDFRRRQRFQALNGLQNAHCNGDEEEELSEDDGLESYGNSDEEEDGADAEQQQHLRRRRRGVFDDLSDEFAACTFKSGSVNSTRTLLPRENYNHNKTLKGSSPLQAAPLLAKSLLVGHSFSIDSLNGGGISGDGSFEQNSTEEEEEHHHRRKSPLIISVDKNYDSDGNAKPEEKDSISSSESSPVNEFEGKGGGSGGKMAKSVSEEMINNLVASSCEKATLSVGSNHHLDDGNNLDNLSSSSTSSLVILSRKTPSASGTQSKSEQEAGQEGSSPATDDQLQLQQRLLSPDELGPHDAFMLFLCLTMLLQSREHIVGSRMDRNDIQMYFDGLIRKHSVRTVLTDARHLFHTYLSLWQDKECLNK